MKEEKLQVQKEDKITKKKVTNDNDEGDDNDKPVDAGDQFLEKQSKKKSKKNLLIGLHY